MDINIGETMRIWGFEPHAVLSRTIHGLVENGWEKLGCRLQRQWSGVVYSLIIGRFCLSVCLSDHNFRKPSHRKFIFAHVVYLQGIRFKFIYKGHRVNVKVTGAKKVDNHPVFSQRKPACQHKSASRRLKISSPITPRL